MKFKLSPLWLFLLLLIVLIVSSIFIKPYAAFSKESFIGFYGSTASNTTGLSIPNYPNKVIKLYDNDFFDTLNGNLLRVYAAAYDAKAGQDTTGATIDHIDIIDRSGKTTSFKSGQPISAGSLMTVPNSYLSWTVYSTNSDFSTITSDQVLYCAWGQDTYIHVLDLNNSLNACGFLYSGESPVYTNFNTTLPKLGQAAADNNTNNNTYVYIPEINLILYQLTSNIAYNPSNGELRIINNKGTHLFYNRAGQSIDKFTNTSSIQPSTTPWMQTDLVGNHLVIYVPNQTKTTIVVLKQNSDGVSYSIVSVSRFNGDGSLQKDANTAIPIPTDLKTNSGGVRAPVGSMDGLYGSLISSFNRNFTADEQAHLMDNMMRSVKSALGPGTYGAGDVSYTNQQISDYILKTQIVPPICPQCPQFPAGTTCTSCGSSGAAGPVAAALAPSPAAAAPAPARAGSPIPGTPSTIYSGLKEAGGETSDLLHSGAKGTVSLAKEGTSGAVNVGRDIAKGTLDVGRELTSGTVGVGREILGGTVGLGREIVGGTVGAVKGIGSDVAGLFKEDKAQVGSKGEEKYGTSASSVNGASGAAAGVGGVNRAGVGSTSAGSYGQGAQGPQNPWTYNGALTDRGSSTFIPVLTDFSKFSH